VLGAEAEIGLVQEKKSWKSKRTSRKKEGEHVPIHQQCYHYLSYEVIGTFIGK
jgi:hypothetical protein